MSSPNNAPPGVGGFVGGLLRTLTTRGGNAGAAADVEAPAPAPVRRRMLHARKRDTEATKLDAETVAADAEAKMKSDKIEKIEEIRAKEEANASDEEEEDEAFTVKRKEEAEAKPDFTWSATLQRKVAEIKVEMDEEEKAKKAEKKKKKGGEEIASPTINRRIDAIDDEEDGAADDDENAPDAKYRNGEPTVLAKSLSRINTINAPTGPTGILVKNPNGDEKVRKPVEEDSYYDAVLSDKIPAYKKPRRHLARLENLETAILDKEGDQLPVWGTTTSDLEVLGPGIGLWFAQLKTLAGYFIAATAVLCFCLAFYVYTGQKSEVDVDPEVTTTLGITVAGELAKVFGTDVRTIMALISALDVLVVFAFMALASNLSSRIRKFVVRVDEALLTLSDFSLQVHGLPADTNEEEIREHFEIYGAVADVVLVRSYGSILRLQMRRANLFSQAEHIKAELSAWRHKLKKDGESFEDNTRVKRLWKKFYAVKDKIVEVKQKLDDKVNNEFKIVCAFVTFEQETAKLKCQDDHYPYFQIFRSEKTKFRKRSTEDGRGYTWFYLKVKQAGEASDILWENMSKVGWKQYFFRRLTTAVTITALLAGNIILVVLATNWSKSSGEYVVNCDDLYSSSDGNANLYCPTLWDISSTSLETDAAMLSNVAYRDNVNGAQCSEFIESAMWNYDLSTYTSAQALSNQAFDSNGDWEGGMLTGSLADECAAKVCYDCMCKVATENGKVTNVCKDYYYDQLKIYGFEVGRLSVVALTSVMLLWSSAKFALFERHKTISLTEQVTSRFAFFTLLTNALVLPLLVNVEINGLEDFPLLFRGNYDDTTLDWYASVMKSIMISAFVNAAWFGPSRLVQAWLGQFVRYTFGGLAMTQYRLNRMYQRQKFTLAERYGQSMTVIFTTIVLSPAAPVLIPAAGLYCIFAYWADKTLLLRYNRYPALYDHTLARQFLDYVPLACLAHFAFGFWVYSQWDIPTFFIDTSNGVGQQIHEQRQTDFWTVRERIDRYSQIDIDQRIRRLNGFIQILPFFMYCFYLLMKTFLRALGKTALFMLGCSRFVESAWKAPVQFNSFTVAKQKQIEGERDDETLSGLVSYRVHDNPEYSALFPESANAEKRMEEE